MSTKGLNNDSLIDVDQASTTNGTVPFKKEPENENWKEFQIPVPWGHVACKWWGSKKSQPILCLHGWQDNAGTFDNLIPLLSPDNSYLCIDLPGHGLSSHYPPGQQYFLFWDGITLIRRIVKLYHWSKVTLMGHSLGGALCFMYAACFPTEVNRFISLDIAGPTVRDVTKTAAATGDCIDKFLKYESIPETNMPCYGYDEMIQLVLEAYEGSITKESCKVLMRRGMAPAPSHLNKEGYHFARDLRLKVSLLGMMNLDQVLEYASRIKCKVLNIRGNPGMKFDNPETYKLILNKIRGSAEHLEYVEVEGTHHLHLNNPERIANLITEFIK